MPKSVLEDVTEKHLTNSDRNACGISETIAVIPITDLHLNPSKAYDKSTNLIHDPDVSVLPAFDVVSHPSVCLCDCSNLVEVSPMASAAINSSSTMSGHEGSLQSIGEHISGILSSAAAVNPEHERALQIIGEHFSELLSSAKSPAMFNGQEQEISTLPSDNKLELKNEESMDLSKHRQTSLHSNRSANGFHSDDMSSAKSLSSVGDSDREVSIKSKNISGGFEDLRTFEDLHNAAKRRRLSDSESQDDLPQIVYENIVPCPSNSYHDVTFLDALDLASTVDMVGMNMNMGGRIEYVEDLDLFQLSEEIVPLYNDSDKTLLAPKKLDEDEVVYSDGVGAVLSKAIRFASNYNVPVVYDRRNNVIRTNGEFLYSRICPQQST